MPPEKSPTAEPIKDPRVPEAHQGIQVNFCKNPHCQNFHVPAKQGERGKGRGKKAQFDPNYTLVAIAKSTPAYKCKHCGEIFAAKSNIGIASELNRISQYLQRPEPSCKNESCPHHVLGIYSHPKAYRKFGVTDSGSTRYQCKAEGCKKTFSVRSSPVRRQTDTHLNIILFKLLMNKMPLGRILEITEIDKPTLYRRIDFFHEQCMRFIGNRA
ncbi:MAG: transposase-like protein, partial [Paraglaciecola psychrophila]